MNLKMKETFTFLVVPDVHFLWTAGKVSIRYVSVVSLPFGLFLLYPCHSILLLAWTTSI